MEDSTSLITVRSSGIRFGLMLGLISVILFLIFQFAGMDMAGPARWIGLPIDIVLIVLAHNYFKEHNDGFMSFGQGVGISFWIALIGSVISSIFSYIYIKFIDGTMMQQIMDKQIEEMQNKGMSDADIDNAMKYAAPFMSAEAILAFGLIGGLVIIVLMGLVISIFTQKKHPEETF